MITVRFPTDPHTVPNGTHDFEGNAQDIILQGHRRSLADWLSICQKTLDEVQSLRNKGLSLRQALVHGLPYLPVPTRHDASLLFASAPQYSPESLSDIDVRMNRLMAHMHLYCEMPERLRPVWSRRLLTECYARYRLRKIWNPCIEDWYPHARVLPLDAQESEDVNAWRYLLPVYLEGNWIDGFMPSARLVKFFTPRVSKQADYVMWYDKISILQIPDDEVVSVEKMCRHIGIHKFTMYRTWKNSGVNIAHHKRIKFSEWKALAKKVDGEIVKMRAKRKAMRKGNMRG